SYTHKSSETIFLGDSLTDYYEWGEALSDYEVLNRGIAGDTTTGVLNRIDEVVEAKPDRIYLLIGINDMIAGQSVNKIETNYKQILDTLKTRSPHTKVYVQSLFPVNTALTSHPLKNATIKELNKRLKDLANLYNYRFIDIYPDLVEFGQLNKDFTFDGIHLNGEGYRIWTRKVLSTYNTNEKSEK
ncbi:MAG: GDSL-type esterase/lipase family protein, partial [Anaerobacillus sp.]